MESVFSGEFQRSTRMPLDAVVRLHFEGTVAYQNGFAANVSATGMFVKHPSPPPVGTHLVFEFNVGAQRRPVQGAGEVVWVRDRYLGPGQPAGIGIRFSQLDAQSRDHIAEALFEFLEQSLSEEALTQADRDVEEAETGFAADRAPTPKPALLAEPSETPEPSGGAQRLDLSGLQPLPSAEAPAAPRPYAELPATERFAPYTPEDTDEERTRALVREALVEPPLDLTGAASVRSGGSSPWVWALLVLVLAGGGYFGWQRWGRTSQAKPAPPATTAPAAKPAERPRESPPLPAVDPNRTLAETVGVDAGRPSAAAAPTATAAGTEGHDGEPPPAARPTPEDSSPRSAPASPVSEDRPVSPPVSEAPAKPTDRAHALRSISTREEANLTLVTLTGDGAFSAGSFSYSEIGGENPRVLIKLKGMSAPFRGPIAAGSAVLRGIRTGYHATSDGSEVHVVLDLVPSARVRVSELAPEDDRLVAVLMR